MRPQTTEALRASGLAHLLAISGLHLGLVGGMVYFAIRRLLSLWEALALRLPAQKIAALGALLVVTGYYVLSGMSVATQRAWIMTSLFLLAVLLDRRAITARTLAIALTVILLIRPESAVTPGFQMSFAATGMLVAIFAMLSRRPKQAGGRSGAAKLGLGAIVVSSVTGSLATAPFGLYHFGRGAPLGILANLLAMPVVTFLVVPAAGLALLLWPLGLQDLGIRLFATTLSWVEAIATWIAGLSAHLPGGLQTPRPLPAAALLIFSAAIALFVLHEGRALVVPALVALAGFGAWALAPAAQMRLAADGTAWVHTVEGWRGFRLTPGPSGLPPMDYADLPKPEDCTGTCRVALPEGRWLTLGDRPAECAASRPEASGPMVSVTDARGSCLFVAEQPRFDGSANATLYRQGGTWRLATSRLPERRWTPR